MIDKIKNIFTLEVRGYIYRVTIAIGAVLAAYGYITGEQLAQISGLIVVILNVMPAANTPIHKDGSKASAEYIPDTQA